MDTASAPDCPEDPAACHGLSLAHRWPGNLRQLLNALRSAVLMAGDADEIDIEHLPEDLFDEADPLAFAAPRSAGVYRRLKAMNGALAGY